ncbi:MAG: hypothetical protein JXA42_05385 [Anaerolineales bacterium]|nr:hypothetical protein [Anaerolineales bacterium]
MNKQNADTISGGIFLIGLGILFFFNWFWPGILVVAGVVGFVNQWMKGQLINGLTTLIVFCGLALVLSAGFQWRIVLPVGLIALGILGIVNAFRNK